MTNGSQLRAERRNAEVSVTDLARALGRSRQTIHSYEKPAFEADDDLTQKWRAAVRELANKGE